MNPQFNFEHPEKFLDKHVVIDLKVYDHDETFIERRQLHGRIMRVSEGEGVVVELSPSGQEYRLPPDWDLFEQAPTGGMVLESTGERVDHVDLVTHQTVHMPPPEYEGPDRS